MTQPVGTYNGKALYNPQGRSGEYARWAVNFYNGCTGGCEYCYNRRFSLLCKPDVTLKSCFRDEDDAAFTSMHEIGEHADEIRRDGGVLLSFVSDPCTEKTIGLTLKTVAFCSANDIPVLVLTKRADCLQSLLQFDRTSALLAETRNVAVGFTLTGHDELEPGCSPNAERIAAMRALHDKGFRTWASVEPVIDFPSSLAAILKSAPFCDHFKIGVRTDRRFDCTVNEVVDFVNAVRNIVGKSGSTVYFKQSLRDLVGGGYIIGSRFVDENYNMFNDK